MDKITRKIDGHKKVFTIYTKDEADQRDIQYTYWKEANIGDYALSDDDYVGRCLKRKTYTDKYNRTKTNVVLCYGTQWVSNNSKILYEQNRIHKSYSYAKPGSWEEKEVNTTRVKNAVKVYVDQLLSSSGVDWAIIGNIYRPDQKVPQATVRRLFKMEKVQKMVDKKLKDVLQEKAITKEYVIDLHKEAIEMAKDKKDVSGLLRATENFMDLLDMKPGKKIVTDTLEIGMTSIQDQIATEEKKLTLQQKKEEDTPPE